MGHFSGFVQKLFVLKIRSGSNFALMDLKMLMSMTVEWYFIMFLFLDNELFTLHLSLSAFLSVPIKSTNVNSIFAMLESPRRFCTSPNFCN